MKRILYDMGNFFLCQQTKLWSFFGTSVVVAVGRLSGDRLATTLVDRYNHHSFFIFHFFFSFFFLLRRVLFS